ncbi:serpin I2-like [Drosophila innubila]|uniref:serpin I2-like n=1 Tax=Drosophila innubila TaxID=198719 RepID=UPI00148BF9B9|nr:serpin I2-like [Drosophila innubila]
MHFKAKWVQPFKQHGKRNESFYLNELDGIDVPMMNLQESFRYADLPSLDASALELPFANSDFSMLIVLPRSKTVLPQLEDQLSRTSLEQITEQLHEILEDVKLPTFKAEFEVELTEAFKQLGMTHLFSNQAESRVPRMSA